MKRIKKILQTATVKDSVLLLGGAIISSFLGIVLIFILTRSFSPAVFGLLITALTFSAMIVEFFDLGLASATINFIPLVGKEKRAEFIKITFLSRCAVAVIVGMAVYFFASEIAILVFKNSQMGSYIRISSPGIFFLLIIFWGQSVFQSQRHFLSSIVVSNSINMLRIIGVLALISLGILHADNVYFVLQIVLIFTIIFILKKIGLRFLKARILFKDIKMIWKFGLPVGWGIFLTSIYTKLDQIMVFNIAGSVEAGSYGLAFRVASLFIFAASALTTAISPRFVSLESKDFKAYFKKTVMAVLGLSCVVGMLILLMPFFLPLVFGKSFTDAIFPFQILSIGMIFYILATPFNSALLYKFKKNKFIFFVSAFSLILMWLLLNFFIPLYGSTGAALAVTIVYVVQFILYSGYFIRMRI